MNSPLIGEETEWQKNIGKYAQKNFKTKSILLYLLHCQELMSDNAKGW